MAKEYTLGSEFNMISLEAWMRVKSLLQEWNTSLPVVKWEIMRSEIGATGRKPDSQFTTWGELWSSFEKDFFELPHSIEPSSDVTSDFQRRFMTRGLILVGGPQVNLASKRPARLVYSIQLMTRPKLNGRPLIIGLVEIKSWNRRPACK